MCRSRVGGYLVPFNNYLIHIFLSWGHDERTWNGMKDPTYVQAEIDANPEWKLAHRLSEVDNDNAPIGWYRYAPLARWLLRTFDMKEKSDV
jgi:hypothetical protein